MNKVVKFLYVLKFRKERIMKRKYLRTFAICFLIIENTGAWCISENTHYLALDSEGRRMHIIDNGNELGICFEGKKGIQAAFLKKDASSDNYNGYMKETDGGTIFITAKKHVGGDYAFVCRRPTEGKKESYIYRTLPLGEKVWKF